MNRFSRRRMWALILLCLWVPWIAMGAFALSASNRLATQAEADVAAHRWAAGFQGYQAALALNPRSPRLHRAHEQMSRQWAEEYDGQAEPATERALLMFLSASGNDAALASVLHRSMATIPEGPFWMGDWEGRSDEQPMRRITLEAYSIDRYEVTHAQYREFMEATGAAPPRYWLDDRYPQGMAGHPVVGVSWQQAQDFCHWAGKRLPTEAEWEKACRGEAGLAYPWGSEWLPDRANVGADASHVWPTRLDQAWEWLSAGEGSAAPALAQVGSLPEGSSPYGVMDLAGNASEWVQDAYNWTGYADVPSEDPLVTEPLWNHVMRGSAWMDLSGQQARIPFLSRCAARSSSHSADDPRVGFRCARDWPGEAIAD